MDIRVTYKDHGRAAIVAAIAGLDGLEIKVGVQGRTGYRAVQGRVYRARGGGARPNPRKRGRVVTRARQGLRVVDLATIHEFGSPKAHIPARSFLRATVRKHKAFLQKLAKRVVDAAMAGKNPFPAAIQLGMRFQAGVQKTITDMKSPPYAPHSPYTVYRRWLMTGETNPHLLIDTGQLRASITHVVMRHGKRIGGIE